MSLDLVDVSWHDGAQARLQRVSLSLEPGQMHAVLGPNGAGKSSLVTLLAGDHPPTTGQVLLDDRPLGQWSPSALAQRRAVMLQQDGLQFGFRVAQVVALGRLPHPPSAADLEHQRIMEALQVTGAAHLLQRRYTQLSGGERQRVRLARVLVQVWPTPDATGYLLLDEPTTALDLAHQHDCLAALQRWARDGYGVLVVLHDPNLALAFADQVSLMCCGELVAQGAPAEVLTPARMQQIFGIRTRMLRREDGRPQLLVEGR